MKPARALEATETLSLPRDAKGWRGIDRANIRLSRTDEGWRSSLSFCFFRSEHWGQWRPIYLTDTVHPTREAAIKQQIAWMRERFGALENPAMQREASEMIAWAEALVPDQMELFAA